MNIPVILVTGFLGSGKTTFLRRLAESHPDWHMVFLVNEFAEFNVDGETLSATGTATHSVVGGSLFCECKAGDFLRIMREEVLGLHKTKAIDAVVIETSGTADPEAIGQLMTDHGLGENFTVRSIISIVAPARFIKMLENLPVIESQILASDLVVINKTDTAEANGIESVESAIRSLNPNTAIIRAEHCKIDYILPSSVKNLPEGTLSTCDANPFDTLEARWTHTRGIDDARTWLKNISPEILRIKGQLKTPEGNWFVERTVDTLSIEPVRGSISEGLVFIAHENKSHRLDKIQSELLQLG